MAAALLLLWQGFTCRPMTIPSGPCVRKLFLVPFPLVTRDVCTLMIIDQVIRGNKVLKLYTGSVYLRCEITIKNRRDDRYLACLFLSRVVRA